MTVDARPVLNLSLALDHAWGGLDVRGYHIVNLAIHLLAGLTLFGIVRRTLAAGNALRSGGLPPTVFALSVAVIWLVHPLQTESVTYIVQRAESLMGLFYLLTLYCFIRHAESEYGGRWAGCFCVLTCLLGMATKEVMVSAPVIVLLYDRTFVTGRFGAAWRRHGRLHLALASTWIVLAILALASPGRGGSSGLDVGIGWWSYVSTQFPVILRYLRLAVWPGSLVFDYGPEPVPPAAELVPAAALILGLAATAAAAAWRKSPWGFLGVCVFAILAPTSLVPGVLQMSAEHRMYLPLAAVAIAGVSGVDWIARKTAHRSFILIIPAVAAALALATSARNEIYQTPLALWSDTVMKRPDNPYARVNLGNALFDSGRIAGAVAQFEAAVRLKPDYAVARNNLGNGLARLGRITDAEKEFVTATRLKPDYDQAFENLAGIFTLTGRLREAEKAAAAAVRLKPDLADSQAVLAGILAGTGDWTGAAAHYETARRLRPDDASIRFKLAEVLLRSGRPAAAAAEYRAGLALQPDVANAHNDLGVALVRLGRLAEARAQFQAALRLRPDDADARRNLGGLDAASAATR